MTRSSKQSGHYTKMMERVSARIISREATESDFRTFFVSIREAINPSSIVRKMLNASAHPSGLNKASRTDNAFHYSMLQSVVFTKAQIYDPRRLSSKFGMAAKAPFDEVYGTGQFDKYYEELQGKDARWWCIRPYVEPPEQKLAEMLTRIDPPDIKMSRVITEIQEALERTGIRATLRGPEYVEQRKDLMIALAGTLHGIVARAPIGKVQMHLFITGELGFGEAIRRTVRVMSHSSGRGNPDGSTRGVNVCVLDTEVEIDRAELCSGGWSDADHHVSAVECVRTERDDQGRLVLRFDS